MWWIVLGVIIFGVYVTNGLVRHIVNKLIIWSAHGVRGLLQGVRGILWGVIWVFQRIDNITNPQFTVREKAQPKQKIVKAKVTKEDNELEKLITLAKSNPDMSYEIKEINNN